MVVCVLPSLYIWLWWVLSQLDLGWARRLASPALLSSQDIPSSQQAIMAIIHDFYYVSLDQLRRWALS